MIESLTPKEQKFKELASKQFFVIAGQTDLLYQKIMLEGIYNAVLLKETSSGQRSHNYEFKLVNVHDDIIVTFVQVIDINVIVAPKNVELDK